VQEFEVDWAGLVQGRSAKVSLQRWRLMQKRVPDYLEMRFQEQLDWIVDKYAPQLRGKAAAQHATDESSRAVADAADEL